MAHSGGIFQGRLDLRSLEEDVSATRSPQHALECWNALTQNHACHEPANAQK